MKIKALLLTLPALLLVACNHNQDAQVSGAKTTVNAAQVSTAQTSAYKDTPKISRHQQGMANFPGKPHAPVTMTYDFVNTAELGKELEIKLTVRVERDTQTLEVKYKTNDSLKSMDVIQQHVFGNMQKGASETVIIRVVPEQAGLHYVNVFAAIAVDGGMQSRSFAIPVTTGSQSTEQMKATQTKLPKGMKYLPEQNVISMPSSAPAE